MDRETSGLILIYQIRRLFDGSLLGSVGYVLGRIATNRMPSLIRRDGILGCAVKGSSVRCQAAWSRE